MPLISVIVPCYNQAQYLDECLQSVLDQTYTDWECIIVNDGSPDHTEEIAKKWVEKDTRFIYLSKENGGLSDARNYGLKQARGAYVWFIDGDDYINDKEALNKIYTSITEQNDIIEIVIFNMMAIFENSKRENIIIENAPKKTETLTGFSYIEQLNVFPYNATSQCYKRSFLLENSLWFTKDMYFEDIYFNLDVYRKCKKIINIPEIFYIYVKRENSITNMISTEKHLVSQAKVFSKMYNYYLKKKLPLDSIKARLYIEYDRTKHYYKNYSKEINLILKKNLKNIKPPINKKEPLSYKIEKKLFYCFPIFILKNKWVFKKLEKIERKIKSVLFYK